MRVFSTYKWRNKYLISSKTSTTLGKIFGIWIFVRYIITSTLNDYSSKCISSKRKDNVVMKLFYRRS